MGLPRGITSSGGSSPIPCRHNNIMRKPPHIILYLFRTNSTISSVFNFAFVVKPGRPDTIRH